MQESIINWGQLLIASGGSLKQVKCFYHLLSFQFKVDGTWDYEHHEEDDRFDMAVPMPDGDMIYIEHASVDTAK